MNRGMCFAVTDLQMGRRPSSASLNELVTWQFAGSMLALSGVRTGERVESRGGSNSWQVGPTWGAFPRVSRRQI